MARHINTVAAQLVSIDQLTESASYLFTLESFGVSAIPGVAPNFTLATVWLTETGDKLFTARHRIIAPSGKDVLVSAMQPIDLSKNPRLRQVDVVGGFHLPEAGRYWILAEYMKGAAWVEATRIPIDIELVDQTKALQMQRDRLAKFSAWSMARADR